MTGDRTGIEDNDIGAIEAIHRLESAVYESRAKLFDLRLIGTAPDRLKSHFGGPGFIVHHEYPISWL
jgi:hypothetical protein